MKELRQKHPAQEQAECKPASGLPSLREESTQDQSHHRNADEAVQGGSGATRMAGKLKKQGARCEGEKTEG